jgi:hypothetical protein
MSKSTNKKTKQNNNKNKQKNNKQKNNKKTDLLFFLHLFGTGPFLIDIDKKN